ncbi:MAG: beta-L-arabinofuranosidase domain-containing protein [Chitinophagaceae bacterium]
MKALVLSLLLVLADFASAQNKDYPIQGILFTNVRLSDNFWLPRIKINQTVTIPASFARCESTGRIKNFEMAASRTGKFCTIYPFDDTDIYKTIEGASFSLSLYPDAALQLYIDSLIDKVAKAQEPDGYLYTARTIDPLHPHGWSGSTRWSKEMDQSHELYNAGHLYEAAAAHFQATGKKNLLNIALKNANLVCSVFGPDKLHVAPGHEVIEMGLVKLYRITGKKEYLQTAQFFIEQRGHFKVYDTASKDPYKNGAYWQNHLPVDQQDEAIGHAVRAGYLFAAMADVAALTGDEKLLQAIDKIWENEVGKKIYVQGGVGAVPNGERFGDNYDLPNTTAYNETCAAIANVYFNSRMFYLHGDSKYIDILEKSLYNGLISGVGMDGKSFFYTNAMQVHNNFKHPDMEAERSGWFPCSCCPTNIVRLIPSVGGYVYAKNGADFYVNLFVNGSTDVSINNKPVQVVQKNNYPWEGGLSFKINPKSPVNFKLMLRIPGWAQDKAMPTDLYAFSSPSAKKVTITINGQPVEYTLEKGYAIIKRTWKKNDEVVMNLPMEVRTVMANKNVKADIGKVALQRGPLIYCAEWVDNNGKTSNLLLPANTVFTSEFKADLLNGVMVLKAEVPAVNIAENGNSINTSKKVLTAIPYYSWAHRGNGEMTVWFPTRVKDIEIFAAE